MVMLENPREERWEQVRITCSMQGEKQQMRDWWDFCAASERENDSVCVNERES